MKNIYDKSSNAELLHDYKGLKEGRFYNLRHKGGTTLQQVKAEITMRKRLGLMKSHAGKKMYRHDSGLLHYRKPSTRERGFVI